MKTKTLFKTINPTRSSAGYTLIEMLIAASATLLVVGAASVGVVSMIEGNKTAKAEVERRVQVNRALDFISDEVRRATTVGTDASGTDFSTSVDKTVVMVLDIPGDYQAVYYLKSNSGTEWGGPQVLYRWGPALTGDGSYGAKPTSGTPGVALIDHIDDTVVDPPNCPSGWLPSPSSSPTGFYACIADNQKMAQLTITTKLNPQSDSDQDSYTGTTNVFARAGNDPGSSSGTSASIASATPTGCTVTGGILSCPSTGSPTRKKTLMTFKVIGSSYACNAQTNWTVNTEVTILDSGGNAIASTTDNPNPLVFNSSSGSKTLELDTNAGETIKIASVPTNPSGASCNNEDNRIESTNTTQVQALSKGNSVPTTAGFQTQQSASQALSPYISGEKINIKDNEIIYLFEIGQTDTGLTGFDLQDNIVLVTTEVPDTGS